MHSMFTSYVLLGLQLGLLLRIIRKARAKVKYNCIHYAKKCCKMLSVLYSASFNTRRQISLLQLSPLLFVRGEEKKEKERRHEEKA